MEKKPVSHIVAGLIIGISLILYSIILQFAGLRENKGLGIVSLVILIGGLIYFITQYGKANDYQLSFGKLFGYGFKATAIITLLGIVFTLIFISLFPEIKEQALENARMEMEKNQKITDAEIEQGMNFTRKAFTLISVGAILFTYLIMGLIGSLIGAAVTRKDPPSSPMDQLDQL